MKLLAGFQKMDILAEKIIFKKNFWPLCLYSERITGHLQQSEDIVAETLKKLWDRRNEFQSLDNIKMFLYRAVRNASINFKISERQHKAAHAKIQYLSRDIYSSDDALANEMLRMELLQEIYNEIENLPEKCGQIFKMIFIQGMTTSKIARELSINIQTVRTQKARAIQLIKTEMLKKTHIIRLSLLAIILNLAR
jgi:RNA polymerase sigma factor (sigma-70 family)